MKKKYCMVNRNRSMLIDDNGACPKALALTLHSAPTFNETDGLKLLLEGADPCSPHETHTRHSPKLDEADS